MNCLQQKKIVHQQNMTMFTSMVNFKLGGNLYLRQIGIEIPFFVHSRIFQVVHNLSIYCIIIKSRSHQMLSEESLKVTEERDQAERKTSQKLRRENQHAHPKLRQLKKSSSKHFATSMFRVHVSLLECTRIVPQKNMMGKLIN